MQRYSGHYLTVRFEVQNMESLPQNWRSRWVETEDVGWERDVSKDFLAEFKSNQLPRGIGGRHLENHEPVHRVYTTHNTTPPWRHRSPRSV